MEQRLTHAIMADGLLSWLSYPGVRDDHGVRSVFTPSDVVEPSTRRSEPDVRMEHGASFSPSCSQNRIAAPCTGISPHMFRYPSSLSLVQSEHLVQASAR